MNKELECLKGLKEIYILSGVGPGRDWTGREESFTPDHCQFFIDLNKNNPLKIRLFTNKIFLLDYFFPMYFNDFSEYFDIDQNFLPEIIVNFSRVDFDKQFVIDLLRYYELHSFILNNYAYYLDKDLVLAAMRNNGLALEHVSYGLKSDADIVLAAVKEDGSALKFANLDAMKHDVLRQAIKKQEYNKKPGSFYGFKPNKGIVLAAVQQNGQALQYASVDLQNDKDIVLAAVKNRDGTLQHASAALQADKEVVLVAVKNCAGALRYASATLQADKEVVLAAVQQDSWGFQYWRALKYASADLKNDKDVVLAAVQKNGYVLQHASADLKNDKDVVLAAVQKNGRALEYASADLKNDKDILKMSRVPDIYEEDIPF